MLFGQFGEERQWWYVRPETVLVNPMVLMGAAELDGSEMLALMGLRGCRADSSRDKHALLPALYRTAQRG